MYFLREKLNCRMYFITLYTIVYKEVSRIVRIWMQTLVPPVITMSLYFFIFGRLVGSRIGNMGEHSYLDFIIPGLIMMSIITNSYANVVSSFFGSKFQKNIEEMMIAPVTPGVIIMGYVAGGIARGFLVGIIVLLVSLLFTDLHVHSFSVLALFSFLSATLFSLAGFTNAIFSKRFDDIAIIPTFVLTPLTYLGGVFYSIDLLSSPWKEISLFNPILYLVNAFRYGFLGHSDISISYAFGIVLTANLVLYSFNYYLIQRGYGLRQ